MIDSEYKKRMYDVLDLYEEDYDPKRPLLYVSMRNRNNLSKIGKAHSNEAWKSRKV